MPHVAMLRRWQANRLAHTYADLPADARYSAACQFFLNDIYAPVDFSQRDHDFERIYRNDRGYFNRICKTVGWKPGL